jgi:hypothetical protein
MMMSKNLLTAALAASLFSAACDPAATRPESEADAAGDERTISPSTDAASLDAGDASDTEPPLIDAQVDAATDAGADAATPDASLCPPFDPGPAPPVGAGALDELVDGPPISAPGGVAAEQLALTGRPGAVPDLLVVRGGRVESLRPDGAMRWRSPAFGALSITSVVDLNGDGDAKDPGEATCFLNASGANVGLEKNPDFGTTLRSITVSSTQKLYGWLKEMATMDEGKQESYFFACNSSNTSTLHSAFSQNDRKSRFDEPIRLT